MKRTAYFMALFIFLTSFLPGQKNKKVEWAIICALNLHDQKFSYPAEFPLPQHDPKLTWGVGAGANFFLWNRFSLETNILYKTKKSELAELSGAEWGETFYKFQYLTFSSLAHYWLPVSEFKIFTTAGLEVGYLLKSRIEDKRNNIIIDPIKDTRTQDLQLVLGLGVKYKAFALELRQGTGLLNLNTVAESDLKVKNKEIEFLFKYTFGK